jgi:predicted Zn-dependent protease with MMP-like domain
MSVAVTARSLVPGDLPRAVATAYVPTMTWTDKLAPSLDDFAALARKAFDDLPADFRRQTGDVVFRIDDFASEEVLDELGIEDPFELTGLYQGVDLARRSLFDPTPQGSMVFLYRRPILDEWCERGDVTLGDLIAHVLVHEIGHHFGLSDDDIHRIEDDA